MDELLRLINEADDVGLSIDEDANGMWEWAEGNFESGACFPTAAQAVMDWIRNVNAERQVDAAINGEDYDELPPDGFVTGMLAGGSYDKPPCSRCRPATKLSRTTVTITISQG